MDAGVMNIVDHGLGVQRGAERVGLQGHLKDAAALVHAAVGDQGISVLVMVVDPSGVASAYVIPVDGTREASDVSLPILLEVHDGVEIRFRRHPELPVYVELCASCGR